MRLCKVLIVLTSILPLDNSEFVRSTSDYIPVCERFDKSLDLSIGRFATSSPSYPYAPFICINFAGNNITRFPDKNRTPQLEYLNLAGCKLTAELLSSFEHPTVKTLVLDEAIARAHPRNEYERGGRYSADSLNLSLKLPQLRELYLRENNLESVWIPSWSDTLPEITHLYMNNNKFTSTSFLSTFPKKLTHLYLDKNRLQMFRTGSLKNLRVLYLDHNPLGCVCRQASCPRGIWLRDAINLQELSLSSAGLSLFEEDAMENLTSLNYLDMSNNKLSKIPEGAFRNLTSLVVLKLDDNALTHIPDLRNSKKLEELNLSRNALHDISQQSFCNLTNLKRIDLSHNEIAEVTPGVFDRLASLTILDLSWNKLTGFRRNWFISRRRSGRVPVGNPINLEYLDLSNNDLQKISHRVCRNLTSLRVLKLSDNALQDIPNLSHLKKLEELNLSSNALRDMGRRIFWNLTNLKHIDLSRNEIVEVTPGVFDTLSSLMTLNLSWNKLKQLPHNWFISQSDGVLVENPMKLEYLDLSNNELWIISRQAFQHLTSLMVLKLGNNVLINIPNLCDLKKLEELNLSSNALDSISQETFCNLTNLKQIDVSDNAIAEITPGVFDMLPSLTTLDLSNNKLRRIPQRAFQNLTSLLVLKLSNNVLKDTPDLCNLTKLEELDLSRNALHNITQRTFCNLRNLKRIDLSHNEIAKVMPEVIDRLPSLTRLDLSWNKFNACTEFEDLEAAEHLEYLNLAGNMLPLEFISSFGHATLETLVLDEVIIEMQLSRSACKDEGSISISEGSTERAFVVYNPKISLIIPQLRHLYLRQNNLESVQNVRWAFSLPEITHLYLSNNRLTSTSFLSSFPKKLTHLYLDENRLQMFRTGSLENLTVLHLDHNPLGYVCGRAYCRQGLRLKDAINLQELSLSSANLSLLEKDAMENLTSLKYLDISNNKLSKIPEGAFKHLTSLEVLKLDGNALTDIPDLRKSEKLEELNLSRNAIDNIISETFFNLTNLKHIDLSHNEIAAVASRAFELLPSLTTLNISWNQLKTLPEYWFVSKIAQTWNENRGNVRLKNLNVLKVLKLENNVLMDIPDICNFQKLEEVDLSHNALRSISQQTFCNSTYLKHINLSHNEIVEIKRGAFEVLPSLTTLDISWNKPRTFLQ